jgi:uncharacterized protein
MLAVPYVVTGRLGLPIGLHLTFNVGVTGLFNVEGGLPALVRLEIDGPDLWVGEAALVETLMIALTLLVTLAYLRSRGPLGPLAFEPGSGSGLAARSAAYGPATSSRR